MQVIWTKKIYTDHFSKDSNLKCCFGIIIQMQPASLSAIMKSWVQNYRCNGNYNRHMTKSILVIFWVMMPCNLADSCHGFGGNCCNLLEYGASSFLQNNGCCLWPYGVLQPRRLQSLYLLQWNLKSYDQNYFTSIIILK